MRCDNYILSSPFLTLAFASNTSSSHHRPKLSPLYWQTVEDGDKLEQLLESPSSSSWWTSQSEDPKTNVFVFALSIDRVAPSPSSNSLIEKTVDSFNSLEWKAHDSDYEWRRLKECVKEERMIDYQNSLLLIFSFHHHNTSRIVITTTTRKTFNHTSELARVPLLTSNPFFSFFPSLKLISSTYFLSQ